MGSTLEPFERISWRKEKGEGIFGRRKLGYLASYYMGQGIAAAFCIFGLIRMGIDGHHSLPREGKSLRVSYKLDFDRTTTFDSCSHRLGDFAYLCV